jgi:aryl-alcohol dehydrogenase-like predicted oxidoreductase
LRRFRIGIGCMRLSTEVAEDPDLGLATIAAALDAGFDLFDTARAYAPGEGELGHNERLISQALRSHPGSNPVRIITKCGMRRDGRAWIPDGRAKQITEDAEESVKALGGVPIGVLLLHATDPRVSLSTTARALARVKEAGLAGSVGVSNVSRKQLEEIAAHVQVEAVEVALGAYDDLAIRSGVVAYCIERGIEILAHAPLGGPDRARKLARDSRTCAVATRYPGATGVDVFLAYLLAVRPEIIPIVGVRRPQTVARLATAAGLRLSDEDLQIMDEGFPWLAALRKPAPAAVARDAEIVMLMGVAGAGKSSAAEAYVARGYERLNRDTTGGSLRAIAKSLDAKLESGARRLVLDNTYVTRASRNDVLSVAARHGARVRCVFVATPLHEAQINVVLRMLDKFGRVLSPEDIASLARTEPTALAPHALSRMIRDLEPPAADEGFSDIVEVPFVRDHPAGRPGLFVTLDALEGRGGATNHLSDLVGLAPEGAPCLVYAWIPDAQEKDLDGVRGEIESIAQATGHAVDFAWCPHPAGPPTCWCRPPLPALFLSFARSHAVDLRQSVLYGASPTDRRIARTFEMSFRSLD